MDIKLEGIGKRYIREWIIRDFNYLFTSNSSTAIIGPNGSGKSTLLKLISGITLPSGGKISYTTKDQHIAAEEAFRRLSFCAPYQELVEEFTLAELIQFHRKFRYMGQEDAGAIADSMQLSHALHKKVYYFSSGMKQRVRLGMALLSQADVTLLDEPTANLDVKGIDWYYNVIQTVKNKRTIIIASNIKEEYTFCDKHINLETI